MDPGCQADGQFTTREPWARCGTFKPQAHKVFQKDHSELREAKKKMSVGGRSRELVGASAAGVKRVLS